MKKKMPIDQLVKQILIVDFFLFFSICVNCTLFVHLYSPQLNHGTRMKKKGLKVLFRMNFQILYLANIIGL